MLPAMTQPSFSKSLSLVRTMSVSYTHLDVYKRQLLGSDYISYRGSDYRNYYQSDDHIYHAAAPLFLFIWWREYSAASLRLDLITIITTIAAMIATAISPGTNPVPRCPSVISVPIWYTKKATVYPVPS